MELKNAIYLILTLPLMIFSFCTMFLFAYFLSSHSFLQYPLSKSDENRKMYSENHWVLLFIDFGLVCAFMMQHSFQSKLPIKMFLAERGFTVIERLIYNTSTCLTLQLLMYFWQPVHGWIVWDLTTSRSLIVSWIFRILHILAWTTIYAGCLLFDMCELMGLKQVYYSIQGWSSPLDQKAVGLLRLYKHMRHPGFTALTFITLVHPVMQADRILLAYAFAIYMILAFTVDQGDFTYHKRQLRIKKTELQISFNR